MSFKQKAMEELKALGLALLYFGTWIAVLILIKYLVLSEYHIAFKGFSVILVGALILSKVVLILEHVSLGSWVRSRPAYVDLILRTFLYAVGVCVVMLIEKGLEGRGEYGGFIAALKSESRKTGIDHVWANTICLTGALLGYNILTILRRILGDRGLIEVFTKPLPAESESD